MPRFVSSALLAAVLSVGAMAQQPWAPGSGIQRSVDRASFQVAVKDLLAFKPDKAPYHLSKRSRAYDHDIFILTPFVRVAAFARYNQKSPEKLTFETLSPMFEMTRLVIETKTLHRAVDKASDVQIALKVDGRVVQPLKDDLLMTQLRSIGFYAQPFYEATKQFYFDLDEFKGAKKIAVMVIESDNTIYELPVDMARLR